MRHDRAFVGVVSSVWSFVTELDAQLWPVGGAGKAGRPGVGEAARGASGSGLSAVVVVLTKDSGLTAATA